MMRRILLVPTGLECVSEHLAKKRARDMILRDPRAEPIALTVRKSLREGVCIQIVLNSTRYHPDAV